MDMVPPGHGSRLIINHVGFISNVLLLFRLIINHIGFIRTASHFTWPKANVEITMMK